MTGETKKEREIEREQKERSIFFNKVISNTTQHDSVIKPQRIAKNGYAINLQKDS